MDPAPLRRAFVHELEHVRRFDWWILLASRVACALYAVAFLQSSGASQ